jgi:PKD repeat protein
MKKILFTFYLLVFVFFGAIAQNTCNISTSFTFTKSGRTVSFSGNGPSDPSASYSYSYHWDFGDSFHGDGQNVDHIFPSTSTYWVCLRLVRTQPGFLNDSCVAYFCDTVNSIGPDCKISPGFTYTPMGGTSVSFSGSGATDSIAYYDWSFGDGSYQQGQNADHTFPSPGNYNVCLRIIQAQIRPQTNLAYDTCIVFFCDTVSVGGHCNISANFTTSSSQDNRSISFMGHSSSSGEYSWDFGDGTHGSGQTVDHIYALGGYYRPCMTFSQAQANFPYDTCRVVYCDMISTFPPVCNVSASFTTTAQIGNSVSLSASPSSSSGIRNQYNWIFDDGTTDTGQYINHTFPSSGSYIVYLIYSQESDYPYDSCISVFSDTIVIAAPDCNISPSFTSTPLGGLSVSYSGSGATDSTALYYWSFGDGSYEQGQNAAHTFPAPGNYNVCLKLIQAQTQTTFPYDTCIAYFCDTVSVGGNCNISANFTTSSQDNRSVSFMGSSSSTLPGEYSWDFGDGTHGSGQTVDHVYSFGGYHYPCMTFSQAQANYPYDTCRVVYCDVISTVPPVCNVSASFITVAQSGNSVSLSASPSSASGFRNQYNWNFGDGSADTGQYVNHTFPSSGTYNVCLTYSQETDYPYDSCIVVFCDTIVIASPDCNLSPGFTYTSQSGTSLSFSGSGATDSIAFYYWSFGDGSYQSGQNADHTFPAPGNYFVCLRLIQAQTQTIFPYDTCIVFFCDTISVGGNCNISTGFTTHAQFNGLISFSGNSTSALPGEYSWDFGDGTYGSGQTVDHTYALLGNYNACMTFRQVQPDFPFDTCLVVYCDTVYVFNPCNASTSFTTTSLGGRSVSFMGNSLSATPGNYKWDFGDGTLDYGQNVDHTFPSSGNYKVCLTFVTYPDYYTHTFEYPSHDTLGPQPQPYPYDSCEAFFCDSIAIGSQCNIIAEFTTSSQLNRSINFMGSSSSAFPGEYTWDFGDGTYGYGQTVNHTYAFAGYYYPCMTFTLPQSNFPYDSCVVIYCNIVFIVPPVCNVNAGFTTTSQSGNSVSLSGSPSSPSGMRSQYNWAFGDGTIDTGQYVNHTFPSSGTYDVCLTYSQENDYPYDSCVVVFCDSINLETLSGINNKGNGYRRSGISVYPTPATDRIIYELTDDNGHELTIEVYNNVGEVVMTETNRNGNIIDINHLMPGLYILRITTDNKVYVKGFVKI